MMIRSLLTLLACASVAGARLQAGELVYGITENQFLVTWDSAAPGALLSGGPVTGLQSNEQVLGIDFRPATGQLYAIGSSSRLYTLNALTGAATVVGAGPFGPPPINGSSFGFDFNPVIDRIRLDSDVNKNYVLHPDTGAATVVTDLFYGPGDANEGTDPNVVHAAYTNSVSGATSTQLYGIDTGLDILVTQANSAGTLGTVGGIGADATSVGGFDISGDTGIAYLAIENAVTSKTSFWTIDLTTGLGSGGAEVGGGVVITALAVAPSLDSNQVPEPMSVLMLAISLLVGLNTRGRC